jgi:hypothetical protein
MSSVCSNCGFNLDTGESNLVGNRLHELQLVLNELDIGFTGQLESTRVRLFVRKLKLERDQWKSRAILAENELLNLRSKL